MVGGGTFREVTGSSAQTVAGAVNKVETPKGPSHVGACEVSGAESSAFLSVRKIRVASVELANSASRNCSWRFTSSERVQRSGSMLHAISVAQVNGNIREMSECPNPFAYSLEYLSFFPC